MNVWEAWIQEIDEELERILKQAKKAPPELLKAAHYALFNGGKRLRPLLAITVVDCFCETHLHAIQPIIALECIHTYSMIHDDLPCMDDDDFRRGQPTVHRRFGEAEAVLTGDFLLTFAFEIIAQAPFLSDHTRLILIAELAKAAGGEGMIAGQWEDIKGSGVSLSLDQLKELYRLKTGALFTACIDFGALIAQATFTEREHLRRYSEAIGLAYQILDDLLDVLAIEKKKRASDEENQKSTFLSYYTIEEAEALVDQLLQEGIEATKNLSREMVPLIDLSYRLLKRRW